LARIHQIVRGALRGKILRGAQLPMLEVAVAWFASSRLSAANRNTVSRHSSSTARNSVNVADGTSRLKGD
jgi:hypothetical protein